MASHIFNLLIVIIIGAALLGHSEGARGDPMMVCRDEDPAGKVTWMCKTRMLTGGDAEVICDNSALNPSVHFRYGCSIIIRDWSSPSPYAHISRIWTCTSEELKKLLFDQDFCDDAMRCNLICGRCSTGWQPTK